MPRRAANWSHLGCAAEVYLLESSACSRLHLVLLYISVYLSGELVDSTSEETVTRSYKAEYLFQISR
jgi:hypothetical protein